MLARIPGSLRRLRLRIVDEQAGHSSATTRSQLEVLLAEVDVQSYAQRLAEAVPTLADAVVVVDGRWINIRVGTFRRTNADEPAWMKGVLDPRLYEVHGDVDGW